MILAVQFFAKILDFLIAQKVCHSKINIAKAIKLSKESVVLRNHPLL